MGSIPLGSWGKGLMSVWVESWWHMDNGYVRSYELLEPVASILPESGSFSLGGLVT